MKITRALSIRQPYAEFIMDGFKKYEFRNVFTRIRERVYIYASKKPDNGPCDANTFYTYMHKFDKLPLGVIIGTVEIVNCLRVIDGEAKYAWQLENPKRLKRFLKPKNKPQPVWFKPF